MRRRASKPSFAVVARELRQLKRACARLERENGKLRRENVRLREENAVLRRAGKRQSAPFSRNRPKEHPKKSGRRRGHAPAHRPVPSAGEITRTEEAPAPCACPHCGGRVRQEGTADQYQAELPPVQPEVIKFRVGYGHCVDCGRRVQGRHPEQTSDALGAASVQLGPRAIATALDLRIGYGIAFRKITVFFRVAFGLIMSAAASSRAAERVARRLVSEHEQIRTAMRRRRAKFLDATGWRVNGRSAQLLVICTRQESLYAVRPHLPAEVIQAELGARPSGKVHVDGAPANNKLEADKQTCLRHIGTDLREMVDQQKGQAREFPRKALAILRKAQDLRKRKNRMSPHGYAVARGRIKAALSLLCGYDLPEPKRFCHPANDRMSCRLHHHGAELFKFLYDPSAEATNNRAEREVRYGVLIRKIWGGNRTWRGARTFEILSSVRRTHQIRGTDFYQAVQKALRGPSPPAARQRQGEAAGG